jgi:hypothetical protein
MTEFNPAAEAERLAKLAVAEGAQIGDILKTDAGTVETDVKDDVEKVVAEVDPAKTVAQTDVAAIKTDAGTVETVVKADTTTAVDAIKTAQAGVQAGVAAAKTEFTAVDIAAGKAHGAVSSILADIQAIPSEISGELFEAGLKLKSALTWIEQHFNAAKKPILTVPPAAPPAS